MGFFAMKLLKKRVHIAKRNLELSFPDMGEEKRQEIVEENFKNTGFAIFETGMAWFWPDWRIRKHIVIHNAEELLRQEKKGRGALVVCVHALNLEITARAFSLFVLGYAVYRPHKNQAYDFIQHWGRTRSGHEMVDRKDVKGMLKTLRKGGFLWYLPDHDYGFKNSIFVPFFAVNDAATTVGTGVLVDASKCAVITASSFRKDDIYTLEIDADISAHFPRKDTEGAAKVMNKAIEMVILRGLDQWMWLHRRFKTMSNNKNKSIRYK